MDPERSARGVPSRAPSRLARARIRGAAGDLLECLDSERDQRVISSVCGPEALLGRVLKAFFAERDGVSLADVSGGSS